MRGSTRSGNLGRVAGVGSTNDMNALQHSRVHGITATGHRRRAVAALLAALLPAPVVAACQISKFVEIPVTMEGRRPVVTAQINGRDARLILDSGAFFSTIAQANALEYGLSVRPVAPGARLKGIGGDTSLSVATAQEFRLAGLKLSHIDFAVGGSDTGYAGLLGQNILGFADVEYDLPHGVVRLMKNRDCRNTGMAYWAGTKPSTMVEIEAVGPGQRHIVGTVKLNGVKLKATFDTGAAGSLLMLAGAKRAGVGPDSPGVTRSGFSSGVGQNRVRTWRSSFDLIDIGGEAIKKPSLAIADQSLADADMLIGIDFFLTHRIYVDNQSHRMFITYEGGPFFGLDPKGAIDNSGVALDLTDRAGEPTDAVGYSQRGARLASARKFDAAIVDFDHAIALVPGDAHYHYQRALAHLDNRQLLLGASDLDRAIELAPGDADSRLTRAQLRLGGRDPAGALADLQAADAALGPAADARLRLAAMYNRAEQFEAAVASYDQWLQSHAEDQGRPAAFNGRCWARALLGRELDKALSDCNTALRLRPAEASFLDSRALVRLRRGEVDKALGDYDAALAKLPRNALALFGRSIAERRTGDAPKADLDRAAAIALEPRVEERARRYRLEN